MIQIKIKTKPNLVTPPQAFQLSSQISSLDYLTLPWALNVGNLQEITAFWLRCCRRRGSCSSQNFSHRNLKKSDNSMK